MQLCIELQDETTRTVGCIHKLQTVDEICPIIVIHLFPFLLLFLQKIICIRKIFSYLYIKGRLQAGLRSRRSTFKPLHKRKKIKYFPLYQQAFFVEPEPEQSKMQATPQPGYK